MSNSVDIIILQEIVLLRVAFVQTHCHVKGVTNVQEAPQGTTPRIRQPIHSKRRLLIHLIAFSFIYFNLEITLRTSQPAVPLQHWDKYAWIIIYEPRRGFDG